MLDKYLSESISFSGLRFFPRAGDETCEKLSPHRKKRLIEEGEKYLHFAYPSLPATLYLDLYRTGNRKNYEDPYFLRRTALSALCAAECAEHQGRFIDDILNGLWCIMEESSWTIPAHNTYVRDTPQHPLPRTDRPILDLFSCETGAILATVYAVLSDELSAIDPEICARIESEIRRRITLPYLTDFFWFMGNGKEPTNNWTVWCTKNVLLSVFQLPQDEETLRKTFLQAVRSTDCFIEEYGRDGGCPEGAGYYHHAALCLYSCIDYLNRISGGALDPVFHETKIRNIASYIMKVHVAGEYYLNYADCDLKPGLSGIPEFLFAKATGQPDMMRFAAEQIALSKELSREIVSGRSLPEILECAFSEEEACAYRGDSDKEQKVSGFRKTVALPSIGVYAAEGENLYLSVKTGDNTGSHKQCDTGSFIIFAKGKPMLVDPGVGTYTRETFSEKRFGIWTMQSAFHNLPTIEGYMECGALSHIPGKYAALDVDLKRKEIFPGTEGYLHSMELRGCYPEEAPIETYIREIRFISDGPVEVTEHLRLRDDAFPHWVLHFMSEQEPEYDPSENTLRIGNLGMIRFDRPILGAETEKIDVSQDRRLRGNWPDGLYRTNVSPIGGVLRYLINIF